MGNGYLEKEIALNIVLKAGKILENRPEIDVIYTREDDTFVDLVERGAIANRANADLFVSVHCDSHTSDAYGAGTFVLGLHANRKNFEVAKKENSVIYLEEDYQVKYAQYDINSPESVIGLTVLQEEFLDQSIEIARLIQKNFTKRLNRKDRKVKQAGFIVLHQTFMPSVLVESGFLTNKEEGAYLSSQKGQSEMGRAIADAIVEYTQGIIINVVEDGLTQVSSSETEEAITDTGATGGNASTANPAARTGETASGKEGNRSTENRVTDSPTKTDKQQGESEVIFKVQIMASKVPRPLRPSEFNGLDILSTELFEEYHRYMYGKTDSYRAAKELQRVARSSGYSGAYIVVYQGGKRIRLTDEIIRRHP